MSDIHQNKKRWFVAQSCEWALRKRKAQKKANLHVVKEVLIRVCSLKGGGT